MRHTETQPRNHVKTEAEFLVILNKPRSYRRLQKPEEARKASEAVRMYKHLGVSLLASTTVTEKTTLLF